MTTRTRIMCVLLGLTMLPAWSSTLGYAHTNASPVSQSASAITDWSRIVYASLAEEDAGIYVANGDGFAPRRLPGTSVADTAPRLNRGGSAIVFVSRRDGNDEIYRMNADGGDVRRLTNDAAADTVPVWSPDGRQIIWARKGSDDSDLYVMNADGSGLRRLTDDPADDTEPAVSPDGTHIAWVRRVVHPDHEWQGTLCIMNSDGSNPRAIGEAQARLARPAWYPDNSTISMTYGHDRTGLYTISSEGGTANPVFELSDPYYINDIQNGGWSPDGTSMFYTLLYLRNVFTEDSTPKFVLAHTEIWRKAGYGTAYTRLTAGPMDATLDWQSLDTQAPSSNVTPLPAYSSVDDFQVQWSGVDAGGAGIANYDVQYRTATTEWQDWLKATTATAARYDQREGFYLPLGERISFRVRARDHAFNTEAWSNTETGDTSTTIYVGSIAGTITDNRGFPVPNASIVATQRFIDPVQTDAAGRFSAYIDRYDWIAEIQAKHPGYTPSIKEQRYPEAEDEYSAYLAPLDNRVVNGTFEVGGAQLQGWRTTGSVRASEAQHYTGTKGALLGQQCAFPCLTEPSEIIEGAELAGWPALVPGNDGIIHAIWQRVTATEPRIEATIHYSQRAPDGAWSTPQRIGTLTGYYEILNTQLAIDGNGVLHVLWGAVEGTYYAKRTPAGQWEGQELIGLVRNARIAADRRGGVHVTYTTPQFESFYLSRPPNGTWATPIRLGAGDDTAIPSLAVSPNNDVHVVWMEANPYPESDSDVLVRTFRADGTRLPVQNLGVGKSPLVVVDGRGVVYVVYGNGFRSQKEDGSWLDWTRLIFIDSRTDRSGDTKYVWGDPSGGFYAQELFRPDRNAGASPYILHWNPDTEQTRSAVLPSFAPFVVDVSNRMHLLVPHFDGLQYRGTRNAEQTGTTTIEQQLTIPATMHQPTLAFMYSLRNTDTASTFSVIVSDSLGSTTVFSGTADALWTQDSVEVSAWSGKTVTVAFRLDQAADRAFAELALDDMTLGSWNTPVITAISPQQVGATASTTITISGDNFIGTPQVKVGATTLDIVERVDERMLRVGVPSRLAPGLHDVTVFNPGGQQAVLPRALRVGLATYVPLIAR